MTKACVYKPFNRRLHASAEAREASDVSDDDGLDHVSDWIISDPDAEPDIMSDTEREVVQERLRRARLEGQVSRIASLQLSLDQM